MFRVIATTADDLLVVLNRARGELRWSVKLPAAASSTPVVVGDKIIVNTADGVCRAFSEQRTTTGTSRAALPGATAQRTLHSPSVNLQHLKL